MHAELEAKEAQLRELGKAIVAKCAALQAKREEVELLRAGFSGTAAQVVPAVTGQLQVLTQQAIAAALPRATCAA